MILQHLKNLATDTTEYVKEDPNANFYDTENELLNKAFSERKILEVLQTLKLNKACGHDQIINEFLKASARKMIARYIKVFLLI